MRKYLIVTITIFFTCFLSCKSNNDVEINQCSIDRTLQLNHGKKWKASGSMTNGINKMNTVIATVDMETFNPKMIGYKLNFEIRMMMSMCNAAGDAHDQFHYYLDPLEDQINGLQIANDIAKEPLLNSIKSHLNNYKKYFN
ncbi:hypothetical protein [uncultured Algibacter sp.]|uniref:hypothetical protein n=1 Tax=uncultured Algibacter sp. TaxID=298659 RepID=UPI0032178663